MTKKLSLIALVLVVACAVAWAGDQAATGANKMGMDNKMSMAGMKDAMMKCYFCKNVAAKMDEIGPMGTEAVQLNDGVEIRHWAMSHDAAKVAAFHAAFASCSAAGKESMAWTDDRAKTDLCEFCQGMRSAMKAGAHMSMGTSKNGAVMVLTSADAGVQAQLTNIQKQCAMMAEMMTPGNTKMAADGK